MAIREWREGKECISKMMGWNLSVTERDVRCGTYDSSVSASLKLGISPAMWPVGVQDEQHEIDACATREGGRTLDDLAKGAGG